MMSASILFGVKLVLQWKNESIAGISHLIEHTVLEVQKKEIVFKLKIQLKK